MVSDLKPVLRAGTGRRAGGKADTTSLAWVGAKSFGVTVKRVGPKVFALKGRACSADLTFDKGLQIVHIHRHDTKFN